LQIKETEDLLRYSTEFLRRDTENTSNDLIFRSIFYNDKFVADSRKSAWLSAAEILKQHLSQNVIQCESKDINYEVAYHFNEDNTPVPTIFLTDTLPNGSGFTEHYFKSNWFDEGLETYIEKLERQNCCNESCYRCLRNYENRFIHNDLNLRLGIDLVKIFQGLTLDNNKIEQYEEFLSKTIVKDFIEQGVEIEEIPNINDSNNSKVRVFKFTKQESTHFVYLVHPLESIHNRYLDIRNQIEEIKDFKPQNFHTIDYLTALNSPSSIYKKLSEDI